VSETAPPQAEPPQAPRDVRPPAWLPEVATLVVLAVAYVVAPDFDTVAQRDRLSDFFGTSAQIIATLLVAVALFQGLSSADASYRVRRFLTWRTFAYIALSEIAAIAGLVQVLPPCGYTVAFVATLGFGAGALIAVLVAGLENIGAQRQDAVEAFVEGVAKRLEDRLRLPRRKRK
jgi:hypothetical protein